MATARVFTCVEVPGHAPFGSRSAPKEITVSTPGIDVTKLLTASSTWDVWGHTSEDAVSDFDLLVIVSDYGGVIVEFTTDKGGEVGTEVFTVELVANLPLVLGSDGSWANYTVDFAGGTLDVIDRIRVRNPTGASSSANVRVGIFT